MLTGNTIRRSASVELYSNLGTISLSSEQEPLNRFCHFSFPFPIIFPRGTRWITISHHFSTQQILPFLRTTIRHSSYTTEFQKTIKPEGLFSDPLDNDLVSPPSCGKLVNRNNFTRPSLDVIEGWAGEAVLNHDLHRTTTTKLPKHFALTSDSKQTEKIIYDENRDLDAKQSLSSRRTTPQVRVCPHDPHTTHYGARRAVLLAPCAYQTRPDVLPSTSAVPEANLHLDTDLACV